MLVSLSLKHMPSDREEPCAICGAAFASSEDSGSRVLLVREADQESLRVLMCGGCHSKWSHGVTANVRAVR